MYRSANLTGVGYGLNFRVVATAENFKKLKPHEIIDAYTHSSHRFIVMNYEGILTNDSSMRNDGYMNADIFKKITPTKANENFLNTLKKLTANQNNSVYVLSSLEKEILESQIGCV